MGILHTMEFLFVFFYLQRNIVMLHFYREGGVQKWNKS